MSAEKSATTFFRMSGSWFVPYHAWRVISLTVRPSTTNTTPSAFCTFSMNSRSVQCGSICAMTGVQRVLAMMKRRAMCVQLSALKNERSGT